MSDIEQVRRALAAVGLVLEEPSGDPEEPWRVVEGRVLAAHLCQDTWKVLNWWRRQCAYTHEATREELHLFVLEAAALDACVDAMCGRAEVDVGA